jgi:hypothetical protein
MSEKSPIEADLLFWSIPSSIFDSRIEPAPALLEQSETLLPFHDENLQSGSEESTKGGTHHLAIFQSLGKYHRRAKAGRNEMFESRRSNGAPMTATETPSWLLAARFSTPMELLVGTACKSMAIGASDNICKRPIKKNGRTMTRKRQYMMTNANLLDISRIFH